MRVITVLQGLLTPTIGAIALYIAWQQWQTNQQKLTLDRYDRRLRVYQHVMGFLSLVLRDFKIGTFRMNTTEADFLFGPEIPTYLDELVREALALRTDHMAYRDYSQAQPEGYNHRQIVEAMSARESWFIHQHDIAKQKFMRYLNVSGV